MRTTAILLVLIYQVRCEPLSVSDSSFSATAKMAAVKWEPFRDIFENIIRPIGGENDMESMLEQVKETDISVLEGTLLDRAKDDPQFVEQILAHLIQIRERYNKLRKDWQKTIDDRDRTAKIFKARIVDRSESLPTAIGNNLQFTQSFTPNTGLTHGSTIELPPTTTPRPPPRREIQTTTPQHITFTSTPPSPLDDSPSPPPGNRFEIRPRPTPPSDFFFSPNHVIDPQEIIFEAAIPQFESRGSPPSPPPHIAARRATATTTTTVTPPTTTQRFTRPWHFSSRATTTIRPETVPWWWTTTTTPAPTTPTTTTIRPTTTSARAQRADGIHFDHANNRTIYRYYWKPSDPSEEPIVPEITITERPNDADLSPESIPTESAEEQTSTIPLTMTTRTPLLTTSRPTTTLRPTTPSTATPSPINHPSTLPLKVPEFAAGAEHSRPGGFRTATGQRVFGRTSFPEQPNDFEVFPQFGPEERPLEPWAPTTPRPTSTTTITSKTSTTERPTTTTTTTEEPLVEPPQLPEIPPFVEDISQFKDEFSEQSLDERELVNILNKEEAELAEAKWFSGGGEGAASFDKEQQHLSGSPKRFIPEFPGEVDPKTFPEEGASSTAEERKFFEDETEQTSAAPATEEFTTPAPEIALSSTIITTTLPTTNSEEPETSPLSSSPETSEDPEDTTEPLIDEVLDETAEELSRAFQAFQQGLRTNTQVTDEPTTETTETSTASATPPPAQPQRGPLLRQGVRPVVVWGRRPPKQPSVMLEQAAETPAPTTTSATRRPRKKITKVPLEISLLDELLVDTRSRQFSGAERATSTRRPTTHSGWLVTQLAREADTRMNKFFEEPDTRTTMHEWARVRGRSAAGRRGRGKGMKRRFDTSNFVVKALEGEDRPWERQVLPSVFRSASISRASAPPAKTKDPTQNGDALELLVQDLQRELRTQGLDEAHAARCAAVICDFEKDDLCLYETSLDELIFGDDAFRRRRKRAAIDNLVIVRSWTNWGGARGDPKFGNIALASGRLPSDRFEKGKNERFAATQVNPNQMAMMSTQINAKRPLRIQFDLWEGTRGVQLRVCCDSQCPFETELGVKRGHRNWLQREVVCPAGTRQLSFECTNTGRFRGACGVDNIRMEKC